jgi:hypothetical protein
MKALRARLIARFSIASIALTGTVAVGQNSDWTRLIDTGDTAMAKHQYSEAERIYHDAVNMAEKHWKKDARILHPSLSWPKRAMLNPSEETPNPSRLNLSPLWKRP